MIATEIKFLEDNESFTLPSNARSIMIEIIANGDAGGIQIMTSHSGSTWHTVGDPIVYGGQEPSEKLISFDDGSENFLQTLKIMGKTSNCKVNLYFGRSK